jgi:hypothetical protein
MGDAWTTVKVPRNRADEVTDLAAYLLAADSGAFAGDAIGTTALSIPVRTSATTDPEARTDSRLLTAPAAARPGESKASWKLRRSSVGHGNARPGRAPWRC